MNSTTTTEGITERVIRPKEGLVWLDFDELWRFRELFVFLSLRDILVRYKQTYLGVAWAILQPLLTTVVFAVVFGSLAKLPSGGVSYLVLAFSGMLPWQFFANALTESSNSLVASARIISKVHFPRLIIPVSAVLSGTVDALISFGILGVLMACNGVAFRWELLLLPLFLAVAFLAALATGIWFSALNVKYRDVKYVVPFITRIGLYVSPVPFTSDLVLQRLGPEAFFLYCLNPMVGAIDGFRWCIFGPAFEPHWPGFWVSIAMTLILLFTGLMYFRNTERTFADIV